MPPYPPPPRSRILPPARKGTPSMNRELINRALLLIRHLSRDRFCLICVLSANTYPQTPALSHRLLPPFSPRTIISLAFRHRHRRQTPYYLVGLWKVFPIPVCHRMLFTLEQHHSRHDMWIGGVSSAPPFPHFRPVVRAPGHPRERPLRRSTPLWISTDLTITASVRTTPVVQPRRRFSGTTPRSLTWPRRHSPPPFTRY